MTMRELWEKVQKAGAEDFEVGFLDDMGYREVNVVDINTITEVVQLS